MNLKAFLLTLFILVCGVFIFVKTQTLGDENSYFNQHTRYTLGQYKWVRGLFSLHNDGDARAEYLQGTGPLYIEVVQALGSSLNEKAIQNFADKVTMYTGRQTTIKNDDTIPNGRLTMQEIDNIVKEKRRFGDLTSTSIFIIYAYDFEHEKDQIASTYKEFGMVLSDKEISDFVKGNQIYKTEYVSSTMLHEFGHQLGLGHVANAECVMAASVESPDKSRFFFSEITPEEFCPEELETLNHIKADLQ